MPRYTAERQHAVGETDIKTGNVYSELNKELRKLKDCGPGERDDIIKAWGPWICAIITGLKKINPFQGKVYRGLREPLARLASVVKTSFLLCRNVHAHRQGNVIG